MKGMMFLLFLSFSAFAQEEELAPVLEDQASLEDVREVEEDLVQLRELAGRQININTATSEQLHVFPFLTDLQVDQLIVYRKYAGSLVDVKELQAVPGWDVNVIRKLIPFINVRDEPDFRKTFQESLRKGTHQLLIRSTLVKNAGLLLRYHFTSANFGWGINFEKDAGERFVQGSKGLSFLSAHALVRNMGALKLLVVGDYILNLGQGLTLWQGRAVRKTGMPIMVKKQAPVLMPYRSNDENRYFKGAAAWLVKGKWETAFFISFNGLDANTKIDSGSGTSMVTSFLNTGYHRDQAELEDKNAVKLFSTGGTVAIAIKRLRVGVSSVFHQFSLPIKRESLPYNLFAPRGQSMVNHSLNFHNTWRNLHVFGELAADREGDLAGMGGVMMAADAKLDLSLVARKIGRSYRSFFANAFTESSEPSNEEGVYTGLTYRFAPKLVLDAYADHYRFPWLRYRADAPGTGRDYLLQLSFTPDKKTTMYARFRSEVKPENADRGSNIKTLENISRQSIRLHLQHKINMLWEWRIRLEFNQIEVKGEPPQHGFICFSDLFWRPSRQPFSFSGRLMICQTTGYDSRIYAYENDVMFYNLVPAFYGKMSRLYINASLELTKNLKLFAKISKNVQEQPGKWGIRWQLIRSW